MFLEEEGEPEGDLAAVGRAKGRRFSLSWKEKLGTVSMQEQKDMLTPSSSMLSRRCRGTIVTISISARKATSDGVSPGGKGWAIFISVGRAASRVGFVIGFAGKARVERWK